jgi:hypothetical protein
MSDLSREPVFAKRDEFRMTKVVIESPLKEFDRSHQLRFQPTAFLHVFGSQAVAPSSLS